MRFADFSDPELVYRAFAHEKRGLDGEPYWTELEGRFPGLSRSEIWQRSAPRSESWVPAAEERYGRLMTPTDSNHETEGRA